MTEKRRLYNANLERYLDLWRQNDRQIPTVTPVNKEEPPNVTFEHLPGANA